jgi:dTDP-4-dehydrorhamnose reductase
LAPDLIVNPAAYTDVDRAEDERDLAFTVSAKVPAVGGACQSRRTIHCSCRPTTYDGSGSAAGAGWIRPPSLRHGATTCGESRAGRRGASLIVRTSWVYAAKGRNFLRTIARVACERAELRVVDDQVVAPTSAALIADILSRIVAGDRALLAARFAAAEGITHVEASGCTSWCGFATAIVDGLRARGRAIKTERVIPIRTEEYPTKARRPQNSRLDLSRLSEVF